ncbi:hypothetical protein BvCmsKSP068_00707 [Escherichia coli]|nr:hypothetical protein BvCmsKSP068_00707 [Escherichia coli]
MRGFNLFPLIQPGSKHTGNIFIPFHVSTSLVEFFHHAHFTGINDKTLRPVLVKNIVALFLIPDDLIADFGFYFVGINGL